MQESYFRKAYKYLAYPPADSGSGLYNAQLGAIHAVASHFTVRDDSAVVTMPTGSGKTAVLMMTPFVLRSARALVITPSKLVREQIAEDFRSLVTLRKAGAVPSECPSPKVFEQKTRITDLSEWEALRQNDVVIATPNCASPAYETVPSPPGDLFDVLLIDEAHHSPAKTWRELMRALAHLRTVLFTATPFRRDRGEIQGRFIYTYPTARAFQDGVFGKIEYCPVTASGPESHDIDVARQAQALLEADRKVGFNHFLMVRTDGRSRADELASIYAANTTLRLDVVHSGVSNKRVKKVLEDLRAGKLDGIICVDMMGEGFDFPRLKIAAIHAPHKSLEVTLQFIGRFTRTNAPDIGPAKFLAVRSDIEIEKQRLFVEGAVWQEIITGLSHDKITQEIQIREVIEDFDQPDAADVSLADLSLYSLYPRGHVKVYDAMDVPNLRASITLPAGMDIVFQSVNDEDAALVFLTRTRSRPKWSSGDGVIDRMFDLFVVFYDVANRLLFVNCSRSVEGLYRTIVDSVGTGLSPLPTSLIKRVIKDLDNQRVFNLGMRNIQASNKAESYRILAGSDTQATITASDARRYRQGHVFLSGEEGGVKTTVGYSSLSKVWQAGQLQIPELLAWCRVLGEKIRSSGEIVTNSGLDYLSGGAVVDQLPGNVVWVDWDMDAFDYDTPVLVRYRSGDGSQQRHLLIDLDLVIAGQDSDHIRVRAVGEGFEYEVRFSLDEFFRCVDDGEESVSVVKGNTEVSLVDYLNEHYLDFFTSEGALLRGNEIFKPKENARPIDVEQLEVWPWHGVNIQAEVTADQGVESIHQHVAEWLRKGDADVILYDHGKGEIADYVTFKTLVERVEIKFYHCKGSQTAVAGRRLEDVYEVCCQAQKSVRWATLGALRRRLDSRNNTKFVRGSAELMREVLDRAKSARLIFEVVVVQPGISRAKLTAEMAENLGATNDHVMHAGCERLRAIVSA